MSKNFTDSIKEIWVVPGFHSDVVWLEDQRDYATVLLGDADQNIQVCRADPHYGVFLHELTYLKPYFDTYPWNREFLKSLIRDGRVGTGGSHSQPAETLIGPEGLIRNIIYGRLFHEGVLHSKPEIYMPWDVFGHSAQLGQILRKSRFTGCIWSKDIRGAEPVFWHLSLDGTRLLFKRMNYGIRGSGFEEEFIKYLEDHSYEIASLGLTSDVRLDAGDFKPPSAWLVGRCAELKSRNPRIIISGIGHEKWFRKTLHEIEERKLLIPTTARDFEWHHQGTGVSRIEFKLANRKGENLLLDAEKFATIANYLGAEYPDKALDKAWRQLLFNQHHDAITGPLCDRSYIDLMLGYREALELGREVLDNSLDYIGKYIDTSGVRSENAVPFAVFNSLNWERTDVCRIEVSFPQGVDNFKVIDHTGKEVCFEILQVNRNGNGKIIKAEILILAEDVPSLGYKVFYAVPMEGSPAEIPSSEGNTIENDFFRITVDPTLGGGIVSLYDKLAGKELIPSNSKGSGIPGNELVALSEDPARHEPAWEIFTTGEKVFSRDYPASVNVKSGPLISKLIIKGDMKDCQRYQEIILYRGIPRVEFLTRLEGYSGAHDLYVITFPADLNGLEPVFEERFGATVKRKSKGYLDFRTWQWRNYSECGARRCYQWFGLGQNGMVECGDKGDEGYTQVVIGMVGLVTGHNPKVFTLSERIQESLIRRGIPVTPFFDDLDIERRSSLPVQDSCMPTENLNEDLPWGTSFRVALDLDGDNSYFQKVFETIPDDKKAYYREQLKTKGFACIISLDHDIPEGWTPLPVLLVGAKDIESLEKAIDSILCNIPQGLIKLPADSNATGISSTVDDYGLILLNTGNVLGSVEHDNTLVLFLMHTAAWGSTPWGKDRLPYMFVPEWKTHQFLYALYPHQGDWRSARAFRAGYEYNNPLIGRQLELHQGKIPPEEAFVKFEGDNLVMTAMKPLGFGTAALSKEVPESLRGIIIRAYEATGIESSGRISFFRPLVSAYRTNLLEEKEGDVSLSGKCSLDVETGPFSIETWCLIPTTWSILPDDRIKLGREKEIAQPVYLRYWRHNLGADPIGYCPVGVVLHGEVKTGVHIRQGGVSINTISVSVVNDYVDRTVSGEVEIITPEGWRSYPQTIEYNLEPGEHLTKDVVISFITDGSLRYRPQPDKGIITARLVHDGQVIEDIMEVGGENLLDYQVDFDEATGEITVSLRNPNCDEICGEVFVVSPIELWSKELAGLISLGCISPRSRGFSLPGNGAIDLSFKLELPEEDPQALPSSAWAIVKLAYNGKVSYIPVFGNAIRYE